MRAKAWSSGISRLRWQLPGGQGSCACLAAPLHEFVGDAVVVALKLVNPLVPLGLQLLDDVLPIGELRARYDGGPMLGDSVLEVCEAGLGGRGIAAGQVEQLAAEQTDQAQHGGADPGTHKVWVLCSGRESRKAARGILPQRLAG